VDWVEIPVRDYARMMAKVTSIALCVPLQQAEEARRLLQSQGLLRHDLCLGRTKTHAFFPLTMHPKQAPFGTIVSHDFEPRQERIRSYQDIVKVPPELKGLLPTSYDVVGEIALVKIPEELDSYSSTIGEAMLEANRHLRTVCQIEPVAGELRVRGCRVIAGKENTVTTYLEYGVRLKVDVAAIYFSPRLSNERKRVASLVQDGEMIVDLFAGVAPFGIMIARHAHPKIVYAIDKNETAVAYARQNVMINQVADRVEVMLGDARDAPKLIGGRADRIIMNLPFSAHEFFDTALAIANDQCCIHYYDILSDDEVEGRWRELEKTASKHGFRLSRGPVRRIKSYSASEFYIGIDITATRTAAVA
jgi:tRNA (guanine37-N1)-methyltransferase